MPSVIGKILQRFIGFQNGDGVRDSSVYFDGHTLVIDIVGRTAGVRALQIRGLATDNAPTEVFGVDKDGGLVLAAGSIETADLADQAVTNAKLNTDTARLNLLVNPGFEIWQRGAGAFTADDAYTADRWRIALAGTSTLSVSRNTADVDIGSGFCAACTYVHGNSSALVLIQNIEGIAHYKSRTVSKSLRIKTSTANAVRAWVSSDGGTTKSWSSYHTGGGAYETLSVSLDVAAGATSLACGLGFAASCTAYADNAALVIGAVPAVYAPLHPADDLARCQRYYEVVGVDDGGEVYVGGIATAGAQGSRITLPFKVVKAVTPTVTKNGTWGVVNCGQPSVDTPSVWGCRLVASSTAAGEFYATNDAAGSNVTAVANP